MLDHSQSRIITSIDVPLYALSSFFEDGTGLIGKQINGIMSATVNSTATNNDLFLGIVFSQLSTPASAPVTVLVTVPASAPYTYVLPQTPNAGQIAISYVGTGAGFTSETTTGAVTATGEFNLTGATLTFYSGDANANVLVTYNYAPTVIQAQALVGYGLIGGQSASMVTNNITVIKKGIVYTSIFDASVNWNAQTTYVVGNNGIITTGTGAAVKGYVAAAPGVNSPFLGIYVDA